MLSQEYVGAIAILVVSVFKMFGIEIPNDAIAGILTGVIAIWIAVRRYKKGDISLGGFKK